jgi:hypothetical protein
MSILKNINYLKKLSMIPCAQADILLLAETAFAAGAPALLELFQPDCNDIIKATLGLSPFGESGLPKQLLQGAGRTGPGPAKHGRRQNGFIKNIARPLQFSPTGFLYAIKYFQIEKYLRWFQIVDVTTSFLANWQSLIYQMQQCQLPGAGTANGYFTPLAGGPGGPGVLDLTPISVVRGVTWLVNSVAINPGFDATIGYSTQWQNAITRTQDVDASMWYTIDDDPTPRNFMRTNDPRLRNGGTTGGGIYKSDPLRITRTVYKFHWQNNSDAFVQPVFGQISIGLSGKDMGFQPFGCKLKPVTWPFPNPFG